MGLLGGGESLLCASVQPRGQGVVSPAPAWRGSSQATGGFSQASSSVSKAVIPAPHPHPPGSLSGPPSKFLPSSCPLSCSRVTRRPVRLSLGRWLASHTGICPVGACTCRPRTGLCLPRGFGPLKLSFAIRPSPNAFESVHRTLETSR